MSIIGKHVRASPQLIRRCREAGLPEPVFRVTDGFSVILRRHAGAAQATKTPPQSSGKCSGKSSGKTGAQIIGMIGKKPDITIPEMAARLGLSARAVEKQMRQLKADELIGRIGPAKGGHWKVLK